MEKMSDQELRKPLKEKFNPDHTFIGAMANNIDQLRYGEGDDLNVHNNYEEE